MAIWSALASVAAPIIGGLFGKKKEEKTTSEIDYVKLRQNAEAAGFNPLTALRSGGGAGFTTTYHPAMASGQFIADALTGVGNVIDSIDPMRDATAKLEFQIKQETLRNLQADTAARKRASLGGVPVATGARAMRHAPALAKAKVLPASAGLPQTPTVETPTLTNPWPTSLGVPINPDLPDASAWEERYGEPGDWIGGIGTFLGDIGTWVREGQLQLERAADKRIEYARKNPYRGPPDPYDRKMYIPPALHGGASYKP